MVRHTFFTSAAVALMAFAMVDPAFAQAANAGSNLLDTFVDTIGGNIGFFIGLAITLLGLWTWIIKQEAGAGISMIIGGVLITLVPQIFSGVQGVVGGVVDQFSAGGGNVNFNR